jgi:thioredoxin-related protein
MKKIATALFACLALIQVRAGDPEWLTDLASAQKTASSTGKMVLIDFTGSDWCIWCKRFKAEALDTQEFKDYAAKNLVLVELDFPRKKTQDAELKKVNGEAQHKYRVDGFPTFVVLGKNGAEIGRQEGYAPGGGKEFIEKLEQFKKKN